MKQFSRLRLNVSIEKHSIKDVRMKQQVSFLTQSKYYSPVFNAAIFDGPIRIYFAQYQESVALKVYFHLQQNIKESYEKAKEVFKKSGRNIFVMLYPTEENFDMAFDEMPPGQLIADSPFGEDHVVGVRGPITESDYEGVFHKIEGVVKDWQAPASFETVESAEL